MELKLLLLCQLSIYCHQILTQFCCRWNLSCHYSLGGNLLVRLNGSHPPTFCTFAGNRHSSIFIRTILFNNCHPANHLASHSVLIITFFSTIWSLGALSGVRLQANGRVISLKRVSRLWSWLLLRVLSTCYFLVYLLLRVLATSSCTCIGSNFGHQVALLALVISLATRWRHLHCLGLPY